MFREEGGTLSKKALGTLTETMFYVLMSFLKTERCGTEVAGFVVQKTRGRVRLGPGTLYTILGKFEEEGLLKEVAVEGRKRTYQLTDQGRALYQEEVARLRACVADADSEEVQA